MKVTGKQTEKKRGFRSPLENQSKKNIKEEFENTEREFLRSKESNEKSGEDEDEELDELEHQCAVGSTQ